MILSSRACPEDPACRQAGVLGQFFCPEDGPRVDFFVNLSIMDDSLNYSTLAKIY